MTQAQALFLIGLLTDTVASLQQQLAAAEARIDELTRSVPQQLPDGPLPADA